jgi:hypothetical protein
LKFKLRSEVVEMQIENLSVAEKFSKVPGARLRRDGPHSAEEFRVKVLIPALRRAVDDDSELHVLLDGTAGYGSSFLEEAFGGLVRSGEFPVQQIRTRLRVVAIDPLYAGYRALAERYLNDALSKSAA